MKERDTRIKDRIPVKGDIIISLRNKHPFIKKGEQYVVDRPHECTGDTNYWGNYVIWIECSDYNHRHLMGKDWEYSSSNCYKCKYDCKRLEECEMFEEIK